MRHFRINLPNRCYHLISRVAHRAFEGGKAANRKSYAAMTRKTYCGNLLWQSSLTLLALRLEGDKAVLPIGPNTVQSVTIPLKK